jgi:hypothetical protein
MEDEPQRDQDEDLPRPAPESGLPGGGSSITGGKAPAGSEEVRENVVGGPASETHGPVAPDDEYGSKAGASAAMGDGGTDPEDESKGGSENPG